LGTGSLSVFEDDQKRPSTFGRAFAIAAASRASQRLTMPVAAVYRSLAISSCPVCSTKPLCHGRASS